MSATACISVECPSEVLLELHVSTGEMADALTEKAALAFFREGKLSSGLAAKWVGSLSESLCVGQNLKEKEHDQRKEK